MNEKTKSRIIRFSAISLSLAAVIAAVVFSARAAAGVVIGGVWNLASLWCLMQMLHAWIGPRPSQRRAIAWLLVKFPLLYAGIFLIFQTKVIPFGAFSVGFTLVLFVAIAAFMMGLRQTMTAAKI